jgi:hypothetical protein
MQMIPSSANTGSARDSVPDAGWASLQRALSAASAAQNQLAMEQEREQNFTSMPPPPIPPSDQAVATQTTSYADWTPRALSSGLYRNPRSLCRSTLASVRQTIRTRVMRVSPKIHQKRHPCQALQFPQMCGRVLCIRRWPLLTRACNRLTMAQQLSRPLNQLTSSVQQLSRHRKSTPLSSFLNTLRHEEALALTS